jgi:predicted NBD/HSP70 family sugar kinase
VLDSDSSLSVHDLLRGEAVEELYRDLSGINAKPWEIAAAARREDASAVESFRRYGRRLGRTLAWVCNVIDPDVAVFGGSVASDFGLFGPALQEALARPDIRLLASALGDQAGVLGAALGALGALGRPS